MMKFIVLTRQWKVVFLVGVFTLFVYVRVTDNGQVQEYKQGIRDRVDYIMQNARLPSRDDVQVLLEALDDARKGFSEKQYTRGRMSVTTLRSDIIIHNNSSTSLDSEETEREPNSVPVSKEVVFPSVSNCNMTAYKEQIKNHKGPTIPTLNVYPCRSWHYPSRDTSWPVVVEPSKGKVLESISLAHVEEEARELVEEGLEIQRARVARLADTCNSHPELFIRQYVSLVWDASRSPPLVYCPIYKVASTTWMVYFQRLAHVNDDNRALDKYKKAGKERKKYMPRFGGGHRRVFEEYKAPSSSIEKNRVFQSSLRFLVVRHPFTRLLSAYRDKIERPNPKPFAPYFKDLHRAIILKYRPAESNITSNTPTFPEFVDYIIDFTANLTTAQEWDENVVCWTPYWVQCGVCSSDYQVVIKLETMTEDEQFLAQIADLKEIQNVFEWRNHKKFSKSSKEVLPVYYKSLTKKQILLLYERFKMDFELFGYTVEEYLDYSDQK
ncbi:carbohydrate sulfotransferase 11-like [Penaeus indicus]|uniref:carbohydrate sulfotransferase 11-like n=1 Tax=Penaeus indicus TaxID=29960 RepID=UPI00300CD8DA